MVIPFLSSLLLLFCTAHTTYKVKEVKVFTSIQFRVRRKCLIKFHLLLQLFDRISFFHSILRSYAPVASSYSSLNIQSNFSIFFFLPSTVGTVLIRVIMVRLLIGFWLTRVSLEANTTVRFLFPSAVKHHPFQLSSCSELSLIATSKAFQMRIKRRICVFGSDFKKNEFQTHAFS